MGTRPPLCPLSPISRTRKKEKRTRGTGAIGVKSPKIHNNEKKEIFCSSNQNTKLRKREIFLKETSYHLNAFQNLHKPLPNLLSPPLPLPPLHPPNSNPLQFLSRTSQLPSSLKHVILNDRVRRHENWTICIILSLRELLKVFSSCFTKSVSNADLERDQDVFLPRAPPFTCSLLPFSRTHMFCVLLVPSMPEYRLTKWSLRSNSAIYDSLRLSSPL